MASHEPRPGLVDLPGAGVPADHGLAALGLVMQLAGRVTNALTALVASLGLVGMLGTLGAPEPSDAWLTQHAAWFWIAIALGLARSQLHRIAGRDLLYRRPSGGDPFGAMRRYACFGAAHAIAIGAIAHFGFAAPRTAAIGIAVALALWPAALGAVARLPRLRALRGGIPLGEDRGLEAASIAMTVLGSYGALSTGAILVVLGALSPHHLQHGWRVVLIAVFALLLTRSALHLRAGLAGLMDLPSDRSFDRPSELTAHYAAFGVVSGMCVGAVLALLAMSEGLTPRASAGITVTCWLLASWPVLIRRFFHQRQFVEILSGDRVAHRRAPDAGLTGLGWILAGHAALVAAVAIALVAAHPDLGRPARSALALAGLIVGPWSQPTPDPGIAAAIVIGELATAIALLRMSDQRRAIATIYAAFAAVVAIAPLVPIIPLIQLAGGRALLWTVVRILPAASQLVLPVATLILVWRCIAPAAQARYRPAPATLARRPV